MILLAENDLSTVDKSFVARSSVVGRRLSLAPCLSPNRVSKRPRKKFFYTRLGDTRARPSTPSRGFRPAPGRRPSDVVRLPFVVRRSSSVHQSPPNEIAFNGDSAGKAFSPPADRLSGAASPYEQFKLCVMRYDSASRQVAPPDFPPHNPTSQRTTRLPNVSTHNS